MKYNLDLNMKLSNLLKMAVSSSRKRFLKQPGMKTVKKGKQIIEIKNHMTIQQLSLLMHRDSKLICTGLKVPFSIKNISSNLTLKEIQKIVRMCGYSSKLKSNILEKDENEKLIFQEMEILDTQINTNNFKPRQPIVTIIGHVNHGKTTLLDVLRKSNVVDSEHGNITQHIAAFSVYVKEKGRNVTFIDTPGHAAFSVLRERGIQITDVAILIIAVDDGIMEQTKECIKFIKLQNTPLVVAINKIDKPGIDVSTIKKDLIKCDIIAEEFGGDVQIVEISAKEGRNIGNLMEAILIQSDLKLPVTDPLCKNAEGYILESKIDQNRGKMCTAILKNGTIKKGQYVVSDDCFGKAKIILSDSFLPMVGNVEAGVPVQIYGWESLPSPGSLVHVFSDLKTAKRLAEIRRLLDYNKKVLQEAELIDNKRSVHQKEHKKSKKLLSDSGYRNLPIAAGKSLLLKYGDRSLKRESDKRGDGKLDVSTDDIQQCIGRKNMIGVEFSKTDFNIFLFVDTSGSLESIKNAFKTCKNNNINLNIIHESVGVATVHDIEDAKTFKCDIISFNTETPSSIYQTAQLQNVNISNFNVIYSLINHIKQRIEEIVPKRLHCDVLGTSTVKMTYEVTFKKKKYMAIGSHIDAGKFEITNKFRLLRNDEIIIEATPICIRHFKDEVESISEGNECGIILNKKCWPQSNDVLQCINYIYRKPETEYY